MSTKAMETTSGCARRTAGARLICLALGVIALSESFAGDHELTFNEAARRWRDTTGNFKVDAALVKYDDRRVTLRGDNGNTIDVSIDKLSASDQVYLVRRLRTARAETARHARITREKSGVTEQVDENLQRENVPQVDRSIESEQLFGVDWYSADSASQIASSEGKPIMWFRVLGDLSGFM